MKKLGTVNLFGKNSLYIIGMFFGNIFEKKKKKGNIFEEKYLH